MNTTITDRLELLLAKIAGQDVDINTMTPGVVSNLKEKLLADIADRIDVIINRIGAIEKSSGSGGLFSIRFDILVCSASSILNLLIISS